MFVSNKNSYENEARAISYKNAQETLKDNSFLKFSEEHQGASFDVADGNWLNFLDNEQFLFMPGIIVISADTSHRKTWLAQAISVGALMNNHGVVKKIIHMDLIQYLIHWISQFYQNGLKNYHLQNKIWQEVLLIKLLIQYLV